MDEIAVDHESVVEGINPQQSILDSTLEGIVHLHSLLGSIVNCYLTLMNRSLGNTKMDVMFSWFDNSNRLSIECQDVRFRFQNFKSLTQFSRFSCDK